MWKGYSKTPQGREWLYRKPMSWEYPPPVLLDTRLLWTGFEVSSVQRVQNPRMAMIPDPQNQGRRLLIDKCAGKIMHYLKGALASRAPDISLPFARRKGRNFLTYGSRSFQQNKSPRFSGDSQRRNRKWNTTVLILTNVTLPPDDKCERQGWLR